MDTLILHQLTPLISPQSILINAISILLMTVSVAVALINPSELEAMHVYAPESWKLIGCISKPPDCSSVNLGTWTEPLAKTCDPTKIKYKIKEP